MLTEKNMKKASAMVLECELRDAWSEVECSLRHGQEPSKRIADYIASIEKERARRR